MTTSDFVKIPISFILEMDDVGWDDGRDLRLKGQASRSGLPRNHAAEDYEFLNLLSQATGKRLGAALCLGDWDKDNLLRGQVGITHDPFGWDRASEIDVEKFAHYRDLLEAGHIDYFLHGLLHGRYSETGSRINENEFYEKEILADGSLKVTFSEEDFRRRLDLFFKIYRSWGFSQEITGFVMPGGFTSTDEEVIGKICRILHEYGIRYWADEFRFPETLRVVEGVALFKWSRNGGNIPWEAYDFDPRELEPFYQEGSSKNSCLRGSHWTNYLRFHPKNNIQALDNWVTYYKTQEEVFGCATADTLADAVNQLFYHEFAKLEVEGNRICVDLEEVSRQKLPCHRNVFYISLRKNVTPISWEGGTLEISEEHEAFRTYKIVHDSAVSKVCIEVHSK